MAMIYAQHFSSEEFREWADDMSPRLVTMLDVLRFRLGSVIAISASQYALGRNLGRGKMSAHNVDEWGEVLAVDCFVSGVYSRYQAEAVVHEAISIGFTGIGVYSDTRNNKGEDQVMFHLDVRPNESMGSPATWGRVAGKYTSLIAAVQSIKAG
jgi:hypothetical protein